MTLSSYINNLWLYLKICFFQDKTSNVAFLRYDIVVNIAILLILSYAIFTVAPQESHYEYWGRTITMFVLVTVMIYLIMFLRRKTHRFAIVFSAFSGTRIFVDLLSLVILTAFADENLVGGLIVILALWRMGIVAQILHEAIELHFITTVMIVVIFNVAAMMLTLITFGLPTIT